eukprot:8721925-Pyramimonas_sp.AAC.1
MKEGVGLLNETEFAEASRRAHPQTPVFAMSKRPLRRNELSNKVARWKWIDNSSKPAYSRREAGPGLRFLGFCL